MKRIGVASQGNSTPRESGQTSDRCLVTRKSGEPPWQGKANDGRAKNDCWCALEPKGLVAPGVYREGEARSPIILLNRVLFCKAFERLEPRDGKLSSAVLRGRGRSNAPLLPGDRAKKA